MTSYLRGWFSPGISSDVVSAVTHNSPPPPPPSILDEDDEGSATETEGDRDNNDVPPAFPSLESAQRVRITTDALDQGPRRLTDAQMMPPPPSIPLSSLHRTGPGSLTVPPSTVKRPSKKREKVALTPGHSPMDWANLKISGQDLRVCFCSF